MDRIERKKRNHVVVSCVLAAACLLPLPVSAQGHRDLTVEGLFQLLETGNHDLRSMKVEAEVAAKGVDVAKSKRLPDIDAALSVSYNGNVLMTDRDFGHPTGFSQPHLGNSFSLEASQTVYAGGAINTGIRLAELQRQQADTGVRLTRSNQRFLALGLYLDLYKTDNNVKVYERNIELTLQLIADIQAKLSEGMVLANDVTRYELQLETLRLGLRKAQDHRKVLNHQLCNALEIEETIIQPDTTLIEQIYEQGSEDDWQARAMAASPTLSQAQLGVQTAGEQLKLARSGMLPVVSIVAADNLNGPYVYDIPPIDNNFNIWYVGIGIRYSLSSLFKTNKSVRQAKVALRQSHERQTVVEEALNNQVQEAYTLYLQSYVDLRTQQKSVQLATQNYQVVNDRFLNQLALVTDMIDASNVKLDAELGEVNARINIVYAYYKMKYLSGEI